MSSQLVTLQEIRAAAERGKPVVETTPLARTSTFTGICGREIWIKAENLQRAGSFKIRGAMNAIALLADSKREAGVVAASAGNHAQGVALAASTLGIPSTVFMPMAAPIPKIAATKGYGAEIRLHGANIGEALQAAEEFAAESGAHLVHPYDDAAIVAGQGSLGLEIMEQLPDPAMVVVPVGGGGLISGTAAAIKAINPGVRMVGVEAEAVAPYVASRAAGEPTSVEPRFTLADGINVAAPSRLCFEHIEAHVDDLITVTEAEMAQAVAALLERAKLLVEAAGAATMAAAMSGKLPPAEGPTVVVLSGGNVDLLVIDQILRYGLEAAGRYENFAVRVPDVPGELARVTAAIAASGANVLSVDHGREGIGLPFGYTEIRFSVETRSAEQFEDMCADLEGIGIEVIR